MTMLISFSEMEKKILLNVVTATTKCHNKAQKAMECEKGKEYLTRLSFYRKKKII